MRLELDREEVLETIIAELAPGPVTVLLQGPPGTGKTSLAYSAAPLLAAAWDIPADEYPVYVIHSAPSLLAEQMIGGYAPDDTGTWRFGRGPGLHAYADLGGLLIIDDLHLAGPDMESALYALADQHPGNIITLPNGRQMAPGPRFRCICTTNGTRDDLSPAVRDRVGCSIPVMRPSQQMLDLLRPDVRDLCDADYDGDNLAPRATFREWLSFSRLWGTVGIRRAAVSAFGGGGRAYTLVEALASLGVRDAIGAITGARS